MYCMCDTVAMSFPATGVESAYRNNLKDVAKMLKTKHEDNYMVRNKCLLYLTSPRDKRRSDMEISHPVHFNGCVGVGVELGVELHYARVQYVHYTQSRSDVGISHPVHFNGCVGAGGGAMF